MAQRGEHQWLEVNWRYCAIAGVLHFAIQTTMYSDLFLSQLCDAAATLEQAYRMQTTANKPVWAMMR
jgi:hypothetical protein